MRSAANRRGATCSGASREKRGDGRQKLLGRDWFDEHRDTAGRDAPVGNLARIVTGEGDKCRRIVFDEQLAHDLETVAVGKRQVEQHEVGALHAGDVERFADGARDAHAVTSGLEQEPKRFARELVVFDEEYVIGH